MLSILLVSGDNVVRVRDDNLESGRELRVGYWALCWPRRPGAGGIERWGELRGQAQF